MMNSAPAVVGVSDGLAAFSRSSQRGPALAWARGAAAAGWPSESGLVPMIRARIVLIEGILQLVAHQLNLPIALAIVNVVALLARRGITVPGQVKVLESDVELGCREVLLFSPIFFCVY